MDFNLDETAEELRTLAAGLLAKEAATDRLEAHERGGAPYDAQTWTAMARAGLLGAVAPEDVGGAGLGPVEMAVVLREVGAHVAPVPALPTLVAALVIGRYGTAAQRERLAGLGTGELVLSVAMREPGGDGVTADAEPDGDGFRLTGRKAFASYAEQAEAILVPTRRGVFLVEPGRVDLNPHPAATGEPMSAFDLNGVRVPAGARLGEGAGPALRAVSYAAITATASGVLDGALRLTTEYTRSRRQFGRALAEFQAVTMQIGDVYIAKRALDVAMWAGAWRLAEGYEDAGEVLAIAAYNVCDPALKALYTCQHLHGGMGLDVTYPLHRYFALGKHCAHLLGGAEAQLDMIGALA
ncbi:acyl-CoA dehydrogenase family protein [Bailinhaonella thermotolerans]|uniref:Acyl-CoA dehydrogenase n=1 Tax=Bailinhaonella thermotolerans TaxID=1070861 RepID=A0A3A4AAA1_9ACTN|nr:acyl-CoA dehydrogenase family protein [Bailinhaonella thermotolerans]RJL25131.1 acyl-CoA dehydrogenase [Bailinhaonella thermotolerans]